MDIKIRPAGHRILVKIRKVREKTASGIILPQSTAETETLSSELGEIIEIGPTAFNAFDGLEAWDLEIGDLVLFARHGGKKVSFPGYDEKKHGMFRIINDEDVVAKIEGDKDEILKEMED